MVEADRVAAGRRAADPATGSRRSSRRGRSRSACVANEGLRHRRGSGPPFPVVELCRLRRRVSPRFAGRAQVARCRRRERPPPIRESAPRGLEDVRLDAAAGGGHGGSGPPGGLRLEDLRGARPRRAAQRRRRRRDRGARAARTSSSTATVSPRIRRPTASSATGVPGPKPPTRRARGTPRAATTGRTHGLPPGRRRRRRAMSPTVSQFDPGRPAAPAHARPHDATGRGPVDRQHERDPSCTCRETT